MTKKAKTDLQIVDAVGVVVFEGDKVLLVRHGKGAHHFEGVMGLPSGKIEKGEQPVEAAVRELAEETGIASGVDNLELLPGVWGAEIEQKDGWKYFNFAPYWCKQWQGEIREGNDETEPMWVKVSQLEQIETLPNVRTIIEVAYRLRQLEEALSLSQVKYQRALADYQNLERQTRDDQSRFAKIATRLFVEQMIMPFDHLEMAAKHLNDKGLNLVVSQFERLFESQGLKEIEAMGKEFDPSTMEVVETREGEKDKVIEVMQKGYELNGVLVRPSRVVVGI